jgi:hypothetical protein
MTRTWGWPLLAMAVLGLAPAAAAAPRPRSPAPMESALTFLAAQHRPSDGVRRLAQARGLQATAGGRVLVDVAVRGTVAAAVPALRDAGLAVLTAHDERPFGVVEGWVAPARLGAITALPAVRTVSAAWPTTPDYGPVTSQGDAAHNAPRARSLFGVSGAGVTVGVISDSFDSRNTGVDPFTSPEFPGPVTIIHDDATGSDEGRAMAEVIADTAPGATLVFDAGGTSGPTKQDAIASLVALGADVIADDVPYRDEPFFQDGPVAQAVDAARAAGVVYLASAGNRGRRSWEGRFTPQTASASTDNVFAAGDTTQSVAIVPVGSSVRVDLQWAEPWGHATTNLDAYLVRADNGDPLRSATTLNPATGYPSEVLNWKNETAGTVQVALRITRNSTGGTPFMKTIVDGDGGTSVSIEYTTSSDTINPDAASAAGALAVGAVCAADPGLDTPEATSSRGPKTRLFAADGAPLPAPAVRGKPDLAAADCLATSVQVPGTPGFAVFRGTSAAVASAAGIAALIRSAKPSLSADQVAAVMTSPFNAIDCTGSPGQPDSDCGAGFLLADRAVGSVVDTTPPAVAGATAPAAPTGVSGWFTAPPTVTFTTADGESPITARSGCDPALIAAQGTTTRTCTATSGGGAASAPVTVRVDSVRPAAPKVTGLVPLRTYPLNELPAKVRCRSSDATSGLKSCAVSALSGKRGTHVLTLTATDNAGLKTVGTVRYAVGAPADHIRPRLSKALARRAPAISALTARGGYRVPASGLPGGRLSITVLRGTVVIASGRATARKGRVTVAVRASTAVRRRAVRAARRHRVVVRATFTATTGPTPRSSATRTVTRLG